MQLTFKVTRELVAQGKKGDGLACPVDRALDVAVRAAGLSALQAGAYFDTKNIGKRAVARMIVKTDRRKLRLYQAELGAETAARMLRFDETGEMEPFEQTVTFADIGSFNRAIAVPTAELSDPPKTS